MYGFDEARGEERDAGAEGFRGITEGWLIELAGDRSAGESGSRPAVSRPHHAARLETARLETDPPRYLQIGTGQWCGAEYATLFPLHSTAIVYAKEFGYEVGKTVRIVKHRF